MKKILTISSFLLLVFPVVASAYLADTPLSIILIKIQEIINIVVYMVMGIATVVFLWGMVKYIMAGADEKTKESSRGIIKAGIIGLFLMVAIWGIVNVLVRTFGVSTDAGIPLGPGYQDPRTRIGNTRTN